ncbi:hypothetical protein GCM10017783_10590 [Deinococcus piscis]|uniref:Inner membrane protein YgaP-like transmembrane domain-containing protein n=1 Tax=Deinococcus piscis TaxID=394230 RepID=A0ABQ3K2G3_9DEIO|nr:DUF2892 domain-containing protein [Deinococcus piscis]GHG00339.1 hypothetical protein GCM10017783_10590 [Deinococcus piscis]
MTQNMGKMDRSLRSVVGGAALAAALGTRGAARFGLLGVGALMLGTASTGHCPAYVPLDLDTRETKQQS